MSSKQDGAGTEGIAAARRGPVAEHPDRPVDPEELELLERYRHDNPGFVCFTDTDDRYRMLEERFLECDLEKNVRAIHDKMLKRRQLLSKDQQLQRLPYAPEVPSTTELRVLRDQLIDEFGGVTQCEEDTVLADLLLKEVAFTEEPRDSLPHLLTTLIDHFGQRLDGIPRRQLRYMRRWMSYCNDGETAVACMPKFITTRVERLVGEHAFTRDALREMKLYLKQYTDNIQTSDANRAAAAVIDGTLTAKELNSQVVHELKTAFLTTYLRDKSHEFRTNKRFERFSSRVQFMPLSHRFQLYEATMSHLIGGQEAVGAERANGVPTMITDEEGIIAKLDDVASCFRLTGHDKSDVQEFVFNVNKRYSAVFATQQAAFAFRPHDSVADTSASATSGSNKGNRDVVDDTSEKTILRQNTWSDRCTIEHVAPNWQAEQDLTLTATTSAPNPFLRSELEFLGEAEVSKTLHRWRERATSHEDRTNVRQRMESTDPATLRNEDGYRSGGSEGNAPAAKRRVGTKSKDAHHQRIIALYQLRYLRTRAFRRRLLAVLNYFASVYRCIALDCQPRSFSSAATDIPTDVLPLRPDVPVEQRESATKPPFEVRTAPQDVKEHSDFAKTLLQMYDGVTESITLPENPKKAAAAKTGAALTPDESAVAASQVVPEWCQMNMPDTYDSAPNKPLVVRDAEGRAIMDAWAVEELDRVEAEMLKAGTYYLAKYSDANHRNTDASEVDYGAALEDLYESEVLFSEGKLRLLDSYREAYEHATDRDEQTALAKIMLAVIHARPRFDTSDPYYTASYTHNVVRNELEQTLLREVINAQVADERRAISLAHGSTLRGGAGGTTDANQAPKSPMRERAMSEDSASGTGIGSDDGNAFPNLAGDGKYGGPDEPMTDTRLFQNLLPGTTVVNVMDIYSSTAVIRHIPNLLNEASHAIVSRFSITHPAGVLKLQSEILQEMLVNWRLLGEEDKIVRQLHQQQASGHPQQTGGTGIDEQENQAALNDIDTAEAAVREVCADESAPQRNNASGGGGGAPNNTTSSTTTSSHSAASLSAASAQAAALAASTAVPEPSAHFMKLGRIVELYRVRSGLMKALFETEILYHIHRTQARLMGMHVKRTQLDAIDFDTRRTFAEIDEPENVRDEGVGAVDADGVLQEVLSVKAETLSNLAIAEFEQSMARFDLTTNAGVRKLLTHQYLDFRRSLTAQVAQKNMLIAVNMCNQVPIDAHLENAMRLRWERVSKGKAFVTQHELHGSGLDGAPVTHTRNRLSEWPGVDDPNEAVDRAGMQKLYVSVNAIKSIHRKCILNEMNSRTTEVLNTKRPELLRRKIKELKAELVHEYCFNVTLATYQYAAKYQACCASHSLRLMSYRNPQLNFFTVGVRGDAIRPQPRTAAVAGETRRMATCLLTRSGKVDDPRYLPHFSQILQLDFENKDRSGGNTGTAAAASMPKDGIRPHDPSHTHNQSHLKTNFIVIAHLRILKAWSAVVKLLQTQALCRLTPYDATRNPHHALDSWRDGLIKLNAEMENLDDPSDIAAVTHFLQTKHKAMFMTLTAALFSLRLQLTKSNKMETARAVDRLKRDVINAANCTSIISTRYEVSLWPALPDYQQADMIRNPAEVREHSPYFAPLGRIRTLAIGADMDVAVTEAENTPAGALRVDPREASHFYEQLRQHIFPSVGSDITPEPYSNSLGEQFMLTYTTEERNWLVEEMRRLDALLDDTTEDMYEQLGRDAIREGTGSVPTMATPQQLELLVLTARRDQLRDLFSILMKESIAAGRSAMKAAGGASRLQRGAQPGNVGGRPNGIDAGPGGPSSAVGASRDDAPAVAASELAIENHVDEAFNRNVMHRAKNVLEKEMQERNEGAGSRHRRRGRGLERDLRRRQVELLVGEIQKLLIQSSIPKLQVIRSDLEALERSMMGETLQTNTIQTTKTSIFTDFIYILMARALSTRNDGDKLSTYHIPEASVNAAIETVGRRLEQYQREQQTTVNNATTSIIQTYQRKCVLLEQRVKHLQYLRSVDERAVQRRVQASIVDAKYDLLFANDALDKEAISLQRQLSLVSENVREEMRGEYEERLTELQRQLAMAQSQYASYKKKLHRDMQVSLEDIKRVAMLSVGKMDNAPLHMKRQALKIAISDDELNHLKEQNAELQQAVVKTKLWYEIKMMRLKASYDKELKEATAAVDATRTKYWGSKHITENELQSLKDQLQTTQNLLSQAELEVELLRRDLQLQLTNKKDLVQWKVQNAKKLEELQKRFKRFERRGQMDDGADDGGSGDDRAGTADGGPRRGRIESVVGSRPGTSQSASPAEVQSLQRNHTEEVRRLHERLEREKRLKEKAFEKVDELRQGDPATNESLVWQRKYLETASELQRCIQELEQTRAYMVQHGVALPPVVRGAGSQQPGTGGVDGQSLLRPFNSATPKTGARSTPSSPAFGGGDSRPGTTATPVRPPPSRLGSEMAKRAGYGMPTIPRSNSATLGGSGLKKPPSRK